jgi:hypothetical protein
MQFRLVSYVHFICRSHNAHLMLDLQLPMESMPIITEVVSSNSAQVRCTRYNIMCIILNVQHIILNVKHIILNLAFKLKEYTST